MMFEQKPLPAEGEGMKQQGRGFIAAPAGAGTASVSALAWNYWVGLAQTRERSGAFSVRFPCAKALCLQTPQQ